jgi:hypothetical protein
LVLVLVVMDEADEQHPAAGSLLVLLLPMYRAHA